MSETIVIYLHADDLTHPSWAILNDANEVTQSARRDSADGLFQIAEDKKVVVIVPGEDVLLLETELPAMNQRKMLQAIPFAVEDKLMTDVDHLHFAVQKENGSVFVATLAQQKMAEWLALLSDWQLKPDAMYPETLVMPYEHNHWHVSFTDLVTVKTGPFSGFVSDLANFATLLKIALAESKNPPMQLMIHQYDEKNIPIDFGLMSREIKKTEADWIADKAKYLNQPMIDLLQGRYEVKKKRLPQLNKLTKNLMYLIAGFIAVLFLYPIISYCILYPRAHALDTNIKKIYQANFPQSQTVLAPKMRMQEKLQHLSSGASGSKVLVLLAYVGKELQQMPNIKIKRIDFQNNQLTIDLNAASSTDIAQFSDRLVAEGFTVKQQNANLTGARMNASLLVE